MLTRAVLRVVEQYEKNHDIRTSEFQCCFCSYIFWHIAYDKTLSAHIPTAYFPFNCLVQHHCLHHVSRAWLIAAAPQSWHQEEKRGEASWRRVCCFVFAFIFQQCPCVILLFSIRRRRCRKWRRHCCWGAPWVLLLGLRADGSAARRGRRLILCKTHIVSYFFVCCHLSQGRAAGDGDVGH